jgi:hypothetical protein
MIFKTKASLACIVCGHVKIFDATTDICAEKPRDINEIAAWAEDATLTVVTLSGVCPICLYQKAA